jgi:hypothetical protein
MPEDELDDLVRRLQTRASYRWSSHTLGRSIGLLDAVRVRLGIRSILPIDITREDLKERSRERANARRRKQTRRIRSLLARQDKALGSGRHKQSYLVSPQEAGG